MRALENTRVERTIARLGLYRALRNPYHHLVKRGELARRGRRRDFLRPFVPSGGLVFDVGANQGRYTETFLELGARVIAVEPNPHLADLIRLRYGRSRVDVVVAALGAEDGVGELLICDDDALSTLAPEYAALLGGYDQSICVAVRTLDSLIAEFGRPDFVKIDVEGYDEAVLSGLSRPLNALSFEYHGATPAATAACLDLVESLGSYGFNAAVGESAEWLLPSFGSAAEVLERIARLAKDDSKLYGDVYAILHDRTSSAEPVRPGSTIESRA